MELSFDHVHERNSSQTTHRTEENLVTFLPFSSFCRILFCNFGKSADSEGLRPTLESSKPVRVISAVQTVSQNQIQFGSTSTGANCRRVLSRPALTMPKVSAFEEIVAEDMHLKSILQLKVTLTLRISESKTEP